MSKTARSRGPKKVESVEETIQRPLPLLEVLVNAQRELHNFLVDTGMQVLEAMLKEEQEALCGPRYRHLDGRKAYRHGSEDGLPTLGGRKVRVKKPRVRSVEGKELSLPSWEAFIDFCYGSPIAAALQPHRSSTSPRGNSVADTVGRRT